MYTIDNQGRIQQVRNDFVGGYKSVQVFSTAGSHTWTKPDGIQKIVVEVVGGGGGGGGSGTSNGKIGASGGGGGYSCKTINVASVASVAVTVGTGGDGGSSGAGDGSTGGTSSFGSYCSATGGGLGESGDGGAGTPAGGTGSGGDININGQDGQGRIGGSGTSNMSGGGSVYGYGGLSRAVASNLAGQDGSGYGGGGGGGYRNTANVAGGNGTDGIVIVWEFEHTYSNQNSALLDGDVHSDTVAQTVTRGSLIYGNSTPKWDELTLGATGYVLASTGADVAWRGGMTLLSTATASASSSIDFTLPSGYRHYKVIWANLQGTSDGATLYFRTSTDGGSSFDAGASDYSYQYLFVSTAAITTASANGDATASEIVLSTTDTAANGDAAGNIIIYNPSAAKRCKVTYDTFYNNSASDFVNLRGAGMRVAAADVDAIRFIFSAGNISIGTFALYGLSG